MPTKIVHVMSFLVTGMSLVACGVSLAGMSQQATAIAGIVSATQTAQALSVPPTATVPADATRTCPEPTAGTLLLKEEDAGYCLLYTEGHGILAPRPGEVMVLPGDPPYIGSFAASLTVNVEGADGRTAGQAAEKVAVEMNCSGGPYDLTIAGEKAVALTDCKGQDPTRKVFIIHADRLFTLTFADLSEQFYALVTTSFTFLR